MTPESVAVEHVSYLRRQGIGMTEALRSIGQCAPRDCGWDDVVSAYAMAWGRLPRSAAGPTVPTARPALRLVCG